MSVVLWPRGVLVAGPLPDGGRYATINDNGSIFAKQGWWRGISGRLRVTGYRLDKSSPPLRADVADGYGDKGFQPVGLTFPTTGCWRVSGKIGEAELPYVVRVVKR